MRFSPRDVRDVLQMLTVPLAILGAAPVGAQLAPADALASMQPAAGLEATLFAAEPEVVNPSCFDIDAHGRLWVCEGVNYRGKARPPSRAEGDRIVVLEDTDGDGRSDRASTFYQGLDLETPLGICWLGDRIYVSQSPRIVSIDIRPDGTAGEKRVFLAGFEGENHDHGVHSLVLGPDGLFYGCFGNSGADVTDRSGRRLVTNGQPYFGGMAFRVSLEATGLEGLAHNFRNNYEIALDSFGTMFQSDNDDDGNQWVRFVYVMPGGNYGFLGPTGRHWGQEKKSHWHMEDPGVVPILMRTGAGSPTGLCVYEGELLPQAYRGMPVHVDAGPRVVQCFRLRPLGAGYHVEGAPLEADGRQTIETLSKISQPDILLTSKDSWFRPSDVAVAPDGSLFVSDWYDPGVGGHGMGDTTRGRIYRLVPAGHKGYRFPPFDLESEKGLGEALASPALSRRSLALLKVAGQGEAAHGWLLGAARAAGSGAPFLRARALWLLARLPRGRDEVLEALADPDPRFRVLAVRCLERFAPGELLALARPLLEDPDPQVRRELLLALRGVQGKEAVEAITRLADQYDGSDRFYLAAAGIAARGRESEVFAGLTARWKGKWGVAAAGLLWELHPPEAAAFLARRLEDPGLPDDARLEAARALGELEGTAAAEVLLKMLGGKAPGDIKGQCAALLGRNLADRWAALRGSEALRAAAVACLTTAGLEEAGVELAQAGRLRSLRPELVALAQGRGPAASGESSRRLRLGAIRALGVLDDPASVPALVEIAALAEEGGVEGVPVAEEAIAALGAMSNGPAQDALRAFLSFTETPALRSAAIKALGATKSGATLLLVMAQEGTLPESTEALATTVVHSSAYEDVRLLANKVLPRPKEKGGKDVPPVAELLAAKGDAGRGRQAFFSEEKGNCGRCHRAGKRGSDVGPDLSAIGVKFGREGLFESILSPSAAISHEYKVWIVRTRSVGLVTGYIAEETPEGLTLRDANGKVLKFEKDDVLGRTPSEVSLMPEGLVGAMTALDLVDIVEFLAGQKPAAPAGGGEQGK